MTVQTIDPKWEARKAAWLGWIEELVSTVESWASNLGWPAYRDKKRIFEEVVGAYTVPTLRVRTPNGDVLINPIALHIVNGEGRIDLEAWPTLNRVKLLRVGDDWRIITDSNVPLPQPWNQQTFVELAGHLTEPA